MGVYQSFLKLFTSIVCLYGYITRLYDIIQHRNFPIRKSTQGAREQDLDMTVLDTTCDLVEFTPQLYAFVTVFHNT